MEAYITFSVPIKKKCDDNIIITHKLRFIDSFRFMNFSLSDLVDNLSRRIFSIFNSMRGRKINAEYKFDGIKGDELSYRYRECKIECHRSIKPLIQKFPSVYQFCKGDLNKFLLLLRKGVYPHEDMDIDC